MRQHAWLEKIWRLVAAGLRKLFPQRPSPLKTVKVEELPEELAIKSIYVAGQGNYLWFAAMLCPCGCSEILYMSLMTDGHPRWNLTDHADGTVSLHPSVWRTKGCRSHFFMKHGLVEWCRPVSDI